MMITENGQFFNASRSRAGGHGLDSGSGNNGPISRLKSCNSKCFHRQARLIWRSQSRRLSLARCIPSFADGACPIQAASLVRPPSSIRFHRFFAGRCSYTAIFHNLVVVFSACLPQKSSFKSDTGSEVRGKNSPAGQEDRCGATRQFLSCHPRGLFTLRSKASQRPSARPQACLLERLIARSHENCRLRLGKHSAHARPKSGEVYFQITFCTAFP